jgi:hypothetical protein
MTRPAIALDDLITALTWRDFTRGSRWVLDRETAELLFVSEEVTPDPLPQDWQDDPRWILVEPIESREGWQVMADFVGTVADPPLAARLERLLHGPKPFRRFKDELLDWPAERERWFAFERAALTEIARRWADHRGYPLAP